MTAADTKRNRLVSESYDSSFINANEQKMVSTQRTNSPSFVSKAAGGRIRVAKSIVSGKKDKKFSYMQIYTSNDAFFKPKAYHSTTSYRNRELSRNPVFLSVVNKPFLNNNQTLPLKFLF
jgi:hypothetical protein